MGGVSGHMSHPWEIPELSFGDLKSMLVEIASGSIQAYEKVDGINMHFTVDANGHARFARNGTDIKNGGISFQQLESLYQNHPAKITIVEGCRFIAESLQNVWWPLGFSRKNWVNCDIVLAERPQLIKYDDNVVILHNASSFDTTGKQFASDLSEQFTRLVNEMSQVGGTLGTGWKCSGPILVEMPIVTGSGMLNEALDSISMVQVAAGLNDDSRVFEYVKSALGATTLKGIREDLLDLTVANLCELAGCKQLSEIKKLCSAAEYARISSLCKKEFKFRALSEIYRPLETTFMRFGSKYLEHTHSGLITDHAAEKSRLVDLYETTIIKSASEGIYDPVAKQKFDSFVSRINSIGLEISPIEGLVYEWRGNTIKLTGTFSLLNRAVGMSRFAKPVNETVMPLPFIRG